MKTPAITACDIEVLLSTHFGYRVNLVVPNVSWGWGLRHEADMIVMRPSGWAEEVEIKCTLGDVRSDLRKRMDHWESPRIRKVWMALPYEIAVDHQDEIDHRWGIKAIKRQWRHYFNGKDLDGKGPDGNGWLDTSVETMRAPKLNPKARECTPAEELKLAQLGSMRIWDLKRALMARLRDKK